MEETKRQRDKETKRRRDEERGRERKGEEETKDERRKGRLFETLMFMNCSRIDHELIFGT